MKTRLALFCLVLVSLSGCGVATRMNDLVNGSTDSIYGNIYAVQQSTQAIRTNAQLIQQTNRAIEENRHHLEAATK